VERGSGVEKAIVEVASEVLKRVWDMRRSEKVGRRELRRRELGVGS